jgi:hypothetical protein
MSALSVSIIVFAIIVCGAFLGGFLRAILPKHHLSEESKDMVKVGIGLLTTLAALVLGLLVASAKSSFDVRSEEVRQAAAKIILLDRNLRQFGPDAVPARNLLRKLVVSRVGMLWAKAEPLQANPDGTTSGRGTIGVEDVQEAVRALAPANDAQRSVRDRAVQLSEDLAQMRWIALEQAGSSIQTPFLVVLVFWLATIAASLGLFAPRNGTILAVTLLCTLAVSSAIFLILEMDRPFDGLLRISDAPMRDAISYLEH